MKLKWIGVVWVLALLLGSADGLAEKHLISIGEFAAQAAAHHMSISEYEIPVYVPTTDRLPVLRVKLKDTKSYGEKYPNGCFNVSNLDYEKYGLEGKRRKGTHPLETYSSVYLSDDHGKFDAIYAGEQPVSASEAMSIFSNMVLEHDDNQERSLLINTLGLQSPWSHYDGSSDGFNGNFPCGELTGIGGYNVSAYPMLHGIPFIANIGMAYEESATMTMDVRRVMREGCSFSMTYYADDFFALSGIGIWDEVSLVKDDLFILDFTALETEISRYLEREKTAHILDISLGYVVYMDDQETYFSDERIRTNHFLAVPTWCAQVRFEGDRYDKVKLVMFNAQTGNVYDRSSTAITGWYAPDLL